MPSNRGRQKQLAKQKKRRDLARRSTSSLQSPQQKQRELLRRVANLPRSTTYISAGWNDDEDAMPALVTLIPTFQAPSGLFFVAPTLVDRTCLGIKNAHVQGPMSRYDLDRLLDQIAEGHGGVEECSLEIAQSIVFHALDYSRSLGFRPHEDFYEPIFGPRPEALLDTPFARPARPYFMPGPYDPTAAIMRQLGAVAGPAGYGYVVPSPHELVSVVADIDDDDYEEDELVEVLDGDRGDEL